ncbi:SPASM domain-containing protein [Flexibacterium corallicola]|uniref:SPASM domain-containing protein n=1 Tax=Flexibacterium corallicola TaxID=3037259 RepID=UPI00286F9433|nr:SPASM domain-containing protein [Pseudovibrio sp. M1P-2-3]
MSANEYEKALTFLQKSVFPKLGFDTGYSVVSIQYVGGEIMMVPPKELEKIVHIGRRTLLKSFHQVLDGAQSNLLGSPQRIKFLDTLFNGRLGTSVDHLGSKRTLAGSASHYRNVFNSSQQILKRRRGKLPGAVFVVDSSSLAHVPTEINYANEKKYSLVLRPVFQGRSQIDSVDVGGLSNVMGDAFNEWILHSKVNVEPFSLLLARRLKIANGGSVCPFQSNCSKVSISLEPDGSLYTCLDMADSGQMPWGNAISGTFDEDVWDRLDARPSMLDNKCKACPYLQSCQGGCMSEAIHATGSPYGRTNLCTVWEKLFYQMDKSIEIYGPDKITKWLESLI